MNVGWKSTNNNVTAKDEKAAKVVEEQNSRFGKLVPRLVEQGHTEAAENITKMAGRADSPAELMRRSGGGRGVDGTSR